MKHKNSDMVSDWQFGNSSENHVVRQANVKIFFTFDFHILH